MGVNVIEVSEYVKIGDWQERARVRESIVVEQPGSRGGSRCRLRKAELLAVEAALRLLPYFEEGGKPAAGDTRPTYVMFDFNPDADPATGASSDIFRVFNSNAMRLWDRDTAEWEFDADVTDFLTGAVELHSAVFYTAGWRRYAYSLPF